MADAASAASIIKIDSDKVLNINGKRTFPVFMYSLTRQLTGTTEEDEPASTTLAKARNFTFAAPMMVWADTNVSQYFDQTRPAYEANNIYYNVYTGRYKLDYVKSARDTSNMFFGYYQYDEPELHPAEAPSHSKLVSLYNNAKSADPNHIVIQNMCCVDMRTYEDTADVITWDMYTWFTAPYLASKGWYSQDESAYAWEQFSYQNAFGNDKNFVDVNEVSRPVWTIIQASGEYGVENKDVMKPKWARLNTYTAITLDVKGIGFFSYKGVYRLVENQTLFNYYNRLAGELRSLNDILVLPTHSFRWEKHPASSVTFSASYNKTVLWKSRSNWNWILKNQPGNNNWYLIVVNKGNIAMDNVRITVAPLSSSGSYTARTLGMETTGSGRAGRTIPVLNGVFTDSFDGMSVHIYQICSGTSCNNPNPTPTCFDNVQNQGETGIDCGGPCPACSFNPPPSNSLTLKPGWNQISSPVAAGINLATFESSCTILPYKNQKLWNWNAETQAWMNPTKVEPLKGYWIYTAYSCTVPLSGTAATFSTLQLYNGWNKISASGAFSAIQGTCANHITGNWIWNWDKATEKWIHPTTMQLDKGYWIKVDQNCVFGA